MLRSKDYYGVVDLLVEYIIKNVLSMCDATYFLV